MMKVLKRLSPLALLLFLGGNGSSTSGTVTVPPDLGCAFGQPPAEAHLGVERIPQETGLWCWAASGQMSMQFARKNYKLAQCTQVNDAYMQSRGINCCDQPTPALCYLGGQPDYQHYGFGAEHQSKAVSWTDLKKQVACRKSPVVFAWVEDKYGSSHMMLVVGYNSSGGNHVEIYDPRGVFDSSAKKYPGTFRVKTFEYYQGNATGLRQHTDDYYQITDTGG